LFGRGILGTSKHAPREGRRSRNSSLGGEGSPQGTLVDWSGHLGAAELCSDRATTSGRLRQGPCGSHSPADTREGRGMGHDLAEETHALAGSARGRGCWSRPLPSERKMHANEATMKMPFSSRKELYARDVSSSSRGRTRSAPRGCSPSCASHADGSHSDANRVEPRDSATQACSDASNHRPATSRRDLGRASNHHRRPAASPRRRGGASDHHHRRRSVLAR